MKYYENSIEIHDWYPSKMYESIVSTWDLQLLLKAFIVLRVWGGGT